MLFARDGPLHLPHSSPPLGRRLAGSREQIRGQLAGEDVGRQIPAFIAAERADSNDP